MALITSCSSYHKWTNHYCRKVRCSSLNLSWRCKKYAEMPPTSSTSRRLNKMLWNYFLSRKKIKATEFYRQTWWLQIQYNINGVNILFLIQLVLPSLWERMADLFIFLKIFSISVQFARSLKKTFVPTDIFCTISETFLDKNHSFMIFNQ